LLDRRLDGLSVGRRLIASLGFEPRAVEFAVYKPGGGYTAERPALPFQFEIDPWSRDDAQGHAPSTLLRGRAAVSNISNAMLPMPSTAFAFTLALPPTGAEELYYRDAVTDAQQAASRDRSQAHPPKRSLRGARKRCLDAIACRRTRRRLGSVQPMGRMGSDVLRWARRSHHALRTTSRESHFVALALDRALR